MGLFDQFPYTNFHELNLDWLIKLIKELENTVNNFVALNTIKYADPIQWNISTQYETNTVVIDPQDGTAYLSSQPVPSGVAISNTDYWRVIFRLNITFTNQNITLRDDGNNNLATFSSVVGDWLIWQGILYKVAQDIDIGDAYVISYNLTRYTVELFIRDYVASIENEITGIINNIGDLNDLNTTDKSTLVAALNEVLQTITTISGNLNDLNTTNKSNLVAAINEVLSTISNLETSIYVNVKDFGATGDGVTDDTQAIQSAVSFAHTSGKNKVYVPAGTYMIKCHDDDYPYGTPYNPYGMVGHNDPDRHYGITLYSDIELYLDEGAICKSFSHDRPESCMFRADTADNIYIHGGHLIGEASTHTNSGISEWSTDEWNYGVMLGWCNNCVIRDIEIENFHGSGLYVGAKYAPDMANYTYNSYMTNNILIDHVYLHGNSREGCQIGHGKHFSITNCTFKENQANSRYGGGLGIEGESYGTLGIYEYVNDVSVRGCLFENTGDYGTSCSDCRKVIFTDCFYDNQNVSAQCYRNARSIRYNNCVMNGKTAYGGFRLVDNGCADIAIDNCTVNNGRIQIEHGTQTSDTSISDVAIRNCKFNGFIITNVDGTDLSFFDFIGNEIQSTSDLNGCMTFRNLTFFNIIDNTILSDNSENNVTLTISGALRGKIDRNKFLRSGGAFINIATPNTISVCDNLFGNGNINTARSHIALPEAYLCNISGNRFTPNISHSNGTLIYLSGSYTNSIINNVVLTEPSADSTPISIMIACDGTNKIAYGNKARSGVVTDILSGTNLTSIIDDITNATF